MIIGIGIDSIDINRFTHWHTYSDKQLARIFSPQEIAYCKSHTLKTAERFAVRFAAREALYKAISTAAPGHTIPFLSICAATTIIKDRSGIPFITLDCTQIKIQMAPECIFWLSVSHAKNIATAVVVIEKK